MNVHVLGYHNVRQMRLVRSIFGEDANLLFGAVPPNEYNYIIKEKYTIVYKNSKHYDNSIIFGCDNTTERIEKLLTEEVPELGQGDVPNERVVDVILNVEVLDHLGKVVYRESSEPLEMILMDEPFHAHADLDSVLYLKKVNRVFSNMSKEDYLTIHPFPILLSDIKTKIL